LCQSVVKSTGKSENMSTKKSKQQCSFRVFYKNIKNEIKSVEVVNDDYDLSLSYEENVDAAIGIMAEEGGLWIDSETILPWHKVELIKVIHVDEQEMITSTTTTLPETNKKKPSKKSKRRPRRKRISNPS